jgi:hypothetical protein
MVSFAISKTPRECAVSGYLKDWEILSVLVCPKLHSTKNTQPLRLGIWGIITFLVSAIRQVRHAGFVSAAEALAIVSAFAARHMGMTILITVIYIWSAMILVVFTRPLNAIVEALALDIAELLRRNVPTSWPLYISWRLRSIGLS